MADNKEKAGKVTFEFSVRFAHDFKDGKVSHYEKGSKVALNPTAAGKFAKMGLGKIVGDAAALEVRPA